MTKSEKTIKERFWKKVKKTDYCWNWIGNKVGGKWKYGIFLINKKRFRAHRIIWRMINGEIPRGFFICHKCDNPSCVNPNHLFLGTQADNLKDMFKKGRNPKIDHCGRKNPFYGKKHTDETRKKMSIKKSKTYKYVSPEGKKIVIFNRQKWCKENNINERGFIRLDRKQQANYKGYLLP